MSIGFSKEDMKLLLSMIGTGAQLQAFGKLCSGSNDKTINLVLLYILMFYMFI